MIDREIVHIVQRTQAVGNIVHSNTIVLQIHNHTNRLSNRELLYLSSPISINAISFIVTHSHTSQELIGHSNIRRGLRNVSERMNGNTNSLDHGSIVFLLSIVSNVIISLLRLLNGSIQNIVDTVLLEVSSNIHSSLISVSR